MRRAVAVGLLLVLGAGVAVAAGHAPTTAPARSPTSAPAAHKSTVTIRRGDHAVTLTPRLELDLVAAGGHPVGPAVLTWGRLGAGWIGSAHQPDYDAVVQLTPDDDGAVDASVELRYHGRVEVVREALTLRLAESAPAEPPRVIGRDLEWSALRGALRVDRGTPILFAGFGLIVNGGAGFIAARYNAGALDAEVSLILDDEDAHPFSVWPTCRPTYLVKAADGRHLRRAPAALERRVHEERIVRRAGDVVRGRARLLVADTAAFEPLIIERWADGARAAVVFTDHADRTDPQALRAVLYGTSNRDAPGYGQGGFFGHGLKITKTFFLRPGTGSLEDDPEARALADEILAAGSEVGPHTITPERDRRSVVAASLAGFAPWHPITWIDHQPETNCEAITNKGWSDDPEYGIHDLLVAAGYVWVWAALDAPDDGIRMTNVFEPALPTRAAPPIFPLPEDPRLWLFVSSWFFDNAELLAQSISDAAIGRLEHERGLFVAHTYLSPSERTTPGSRHRGMLAVEERADGVLELSPALDAALGRLGDEVKAGALSTLTWREAGERLRALGDLHVRYRGDGTVDLDNDSERAIPGLTVALPGDAPDLAVSGAVERGRRYETDRTQVWFDVLPRAHLSFKNPSNVWPAGGPATVEVQ